MPYLVNALSTPAPTTFLAQISVQINNMTTVDLPLMVYLVFNLVVLAGICYVLRALLRAARTLREIEVVRVRRMAKESPVDPMRAKESPVDPMRAQESPVDPMRAKESPVDPMRAVDSHLNWLDIKHRKFLRRNGHESADAAIILGGLKLAQHRAHIPGTPAPVIPAPMLKNYRDYFGRWGMFKMVRFSGRITARLVDEPAGHIVYRKFAEKVLNDWQLKEMLGSIDKFAPEPTTAGLVGGGKRSGGGVER